jgi:hypothetical protein
MEPSVKQVAQCLRHWESASESTDRPSVPVGITVLSVSETPTYTWDPYQAIRVTCTATSIACRPPPTQTPLIGVTSP